MIRLDIVKLFSLVHIIGFVQTNEFRGGEFSLKCPMAVENFANFVPNILPPKSNDTASNGTSQPSYHYQVAAAYDIGLSQLQAILSAHNNLPVNSMLNKLHLSGSACPLKSNLTCDPNAKYRNFDGSCNNLENPILGQSNRQFKRFLDSEYDNGYDSIRTKSVVSNNKLPNPRLISRSIINHNPYLDKSRSNLFTTFGQFLTHDISHSPFMKEKNGDGIKCSCDSKNPACISVDLPENDITGLSCMRAVRTTPIFRTNDCKLGKREQLNAQTTYIDGSNIYGKTKMESENLRSFKDGKLKTSNGTEYRRDFLSHSPNVICSTKVKENKCFVSGEFFRVCENLALTGAHTLFLREHNRIAENLATVNPHWNEEKLFMESRRINIAGYQHVVFNGYLQALFDPKDYKVRELLPLKNGYFKGYDSSIDVRLTNEFSVAAMRFGHSMIRNKQNRYNSNNEIINGGEMKLSDTLFNIDEAYNKEKGGLDSIFLGLINEKSARLDLGMAGFLQNAQKTSPKAQHPNDLGSLNIQRGRDHGIPSYTKYVEKCSGKSIKNWKSLEKFISCDNIKKLRQVYENVHDIDLWVGGLSETIVNKRTVLGATFRCLIIDQFAELKRGDRFYYENAPMTNTSNDIAFTPEQLNEIRKISLSSLICNNYEISSIQKNSFFIANVDNQHQKCSFFDQIDFRKWKET